MKPSNFSCTLLVKDTLVEILTSLPPSYNRASTSLSSGNTSGGSISTWFINSMFGKPGGPRISNDSGYSSGSAGSSINGVSGGSAGHISGASSRSVSVTSSVSNGGAGSGHNSELASPTNESSTSRSLSPTPWEAVMNWLLPQGAKPSDLTESTVDPVPENGKVTTIGETETSVKSYHKKQASWPMIGKLLPENIDTPPLNVILRVQPHSTGLKSFHDDVKQLDVFVHPLTLPVLYARRHTGQEVSNAGFLVKLQKVLPPEKPAKKQPKSEQDDDIIPAPQAPQMEDKESVKALVVRLCFTSHYKSNAQECLGNYIKIKPGHILISDCVRQQMGIRDFSHVRLTDVTNSMRTPCNGHTIKLTPLDKNGMADKELRIMFQNWVQKVGIHSPYSVPLAYHMILTFQKKSGSLFNIEVKVTGSAKMKQNKDEAVSEDINKEIDFIILEHRDITSNRVTLSVDMDPIKTSSLSSDKSSATASNSSGDKKTFRLPEMTQFREPLVLEALCPLGGIDNYVSEGFKWVTNALEKQLGTNSIMHGLNAGGFLICGRSKNGNSGCGITSIAKEICRQAIDYPLLAHVIVLDCSDYRTRAARFKEHLLDKLSEARWFQPSILVLDDLDAIAPSLYHGQREHGVEAASANRIAEITRDALNEEMSRGSSIVVMATAQSINSLHPKLMPSRGNHLFRKTIEVSTPNMGAREEILKMIISNKRITVADNIDWRKVCGQMEGFVVKDLINMVERAVHHSERRSGGHDSILVPVRVHRSPSVETIAPIQPKELNYEDFQKALENYKPVPLRNIALYKPEDITFDDIGGLNYIKTLLIETMLWPVKYPKVHSSFTLKRTSGVLLYGAPGTGKTMLAKAVGKQFGLNFISIKGPELLSKYIGASEQAIRDVFVRAHSAKPCILFFDEFDALAPQRGHDNTGVTDRVVNQLLTQLDGLETLEGVCILAASSRPELIDPALLRPGRIDHHLHCELPNLDERVEILKALSKSLTLSSGIDFYEIANECEYFTGADLKALLYNAQLLVAHRLIDSKNNSEKNDKVALNRTLSDNNRILFSSNVSSPDEKEISQRLKIMQRNSTKHKIKKKQITTPENLIVMQEDLMNVTYDMQPSLSKKDREHFLRLYDNFVNKSSVTTAEYMNQKATLA